MFEVEITRGRTAASQPASDKVRDAAIQAILGPMARHPRRVGKPLVGDRLLSARPAVWVTRLTRRAGRALTSRQ
jgi:hypothetical protein